MDSGVPYYWFGGGPREPWTGLVYMSRIQDRLQFLVKNSKRTHSSLLLIVNYKTPWNARYAQMEWDFVQYSFVFARSLPSLSIVDAPILVSTEVLKMFACRWCLHGINIFLLDPCYCCPSKTWSSCHLKIVSFSGPNKSYAVKLCQILSTVHCCYSYTALCCISSHRRHPVKFISLSGGGETIKCRATIFFFFLVPFL